MRALLIPVVGCLVFLLQPVEAAKLRSLQVGEWSGGSFSNDATKKFSHCAATAKYKSGIYVTLIVNKEYNWGVGFSHPEWTLREGTKIDLAYVVDAGEARPTTGTATSTNQILIGFGGNVDRFREFSRGHQLRVAAERKVFTFELTDTSKLLPILLNCVSTQLNPAPVVAAAKPEQDFRSEATVIAANLLSQAGISGFRIATSAELPTIKADVAWVTENLVGTVNVFPRIDKKDIDEVRSIVIGADAKSCKGTFLSGSTPDDGKDGAIARVFTSCHSDASSTSYYLAVPRKAGGIYLFRTMSNGLSEKPAKEADASIRKAVFTAVPK